MGDVEVGDDCTELLNVPVLFSVFFYVRHFPSFPVLAAGSKSKREADSAKHGLGRRGAGEPRRAAQARRREQCAATSGE